MEKLQMYSQVETFRPRSSVTFRIASLMHHLSIDHQFNIELVELLENSTTLQLKTFDICAE